MAQLTELDLNILADLKRPVSMESYVIPFVLNVHIYRAGRLVNGGTLEGDRVE